MSERLYCALCGRPAPALAEECCSDRCRELRDSGYASPRVPAAALEPPRAAWELRALATGALPASLPEGVVHAGSIGDTGATRELLRVGAGSLQELESAVEALAAELGPDAIEVFTVHRYSAAGLAGRKRTRTGGRG